MVPRVAKAPMPTSTVKTSKKLLTHQGLTLIEILVALLLISLLFTLIPSSDDSRRHQDLMRSLDDIDRAVRFASNEAILRNSITRIRVDLDKNPAEYSIEYGPKGDLVIPLATEQKDLSIEDQKKEKEKQEKLDSQFHKVEEFAEVSREFPVEVQFLGIATAWSKTLQKTGQAQAYFYPTGERDGALFFLATQDEMGVLEIFPFQEKTVANYFPFPRSQEGDNAVAKAQEFQENKMEELFKTWLEK